MFSYVIKLTLSLGGFLLLLLDKFLLLHLLLDLYLPSLFHLHLLSHSLLLLLGLKLKLSLLFLLLGPQKPRLLFCNHISGDGSSTAPCWSCLGPWIYPINTLKAPTCQLTCVGVTPAPGGSVGPDVDPLDVVAGQVQ